MRPFPRGVTGYEFIYSFLLVQGHPKKEAEAMSWQAIERVDLVEAAHRKVAGYSKGMRQRIKLAQALAHDGEIGRHAAHGIRRPRRGVL